MLPVRRPKMTMSSVPTVCRVISRQQRPAQGWFPRKASPEGPENRFVRDPPQKRDGQASWVTRRRQGVRLTQCQVEALSFPVWQRRIGIPDAIASQKAAELAP